MDTNLLSNDNHLSADNNNRQLSEALWLSDLTATQKYILNNAHYLNNNKDGLAWTKEQGAPPETKEQEETDHHYNKETDKNIKGMLGRNSLIHSTLGLKQGGRSTTMSESSGGLSYSYSGGSGSLQQHGEMATKVEMVYNLLSMLGTHDRTEMTSTLLAMSSSPDSCIAMRHSGCLSLLVQLVHSSSESEAVRCRAAQALRNMVLSQPDDKRGRREARVLRLLDQLTTYCDLIHNNPATHTEEAHPGPAIAALMKLSFDEEHRLAMCHLGALYVIARLIQVEGDYRLDCCVTVKRYGGMALTNLTFGDGNNKALLCSMKPFMNALIAQLDSSSEDLTQVTASVLRNLSWRADAGSKQALRDVGAVTALMKAAMKAMKEPTLKSVLSALWNLSAHCNQNKIDICAVDGAIQYLVDMLSYQSASKTLSVVENAGGILRNISSHIALREDYRKLLREANCLVVLLRQLQSASLTVVSNACGTLWNLSARCPTDQRSLVNLGAVPMLTSLAHSKHRMIAMGASAALKNLLPVRLQHQHHTASSGGATLLARKKRALEAELNSSLAETCDNIEPGATWDTTADTVSHTSASPQSKDECEEINRSVKEMSLDEATDQPVDYSLKYRETEMRSAPPDNVAVGYNLKYSQEKDEKVYCKTECYRREGDYAETDLDQLTDYSLRYSEELPPPQVDSAEATPLHPQEVTEDVGESQDAQIVAVDDTLPEKHDSGKGGIVETPLMFSRCSSLGSLGSCEPPGDDCHSSVVSEFSRMTSGVLSPSDLPDSPSQTVALSPRSCQPPPVQEKRESIEKTMTGGVFDDTVVNFKEESTPVQFSTATSLSDLTILSDDPNLMEVVGGSVGVTALDRKDPELPVVSEEEDEDVLANCIQAGMQENREQVESVRAEQHQQRRVGAPLPKPNCESSKHHSQAPTPPHHEEERPVKFCTEDTPASLSHATSHSELSLLGTASDDDHDNVLAECTQCTAMPQGGHKADKKKNVSLACIKPALPTARVSPLVKSRPTRTSGVGAAAPCCAEDVVSVFATEDTPCTFSVRSSLSDLTISTNRSNRSVAETPPPAVETSSPLSSLDPDVDEGEVVTVLSGGSGGDETTLREQEDQALLMQVISSGMSSVSVDEGETVTVLSGGSGRDETTLREQEDQALLMQVISSGMSSVDAGKTMTVLSGGSGRDKTSLREQEDQVLLMQVISSGMSSVSVNEVETVTVLSGGSGRDATTLREQEDQALLMQVISSGMSSVSDKKESESWPDDTTISLSEVSLASQRDDGVVELEGGGVALISHLELESVEPPSNMVSVTSISSMGPSSLGAGLGTLDAVEPPSHLDSILSISSAQNTMLLDQVKPPADMDELIDLDNSITSCASLTSELADDSKHSSLNLNQSQSHSLGLPHFSSLSYTVANVSVAPMPNSDHLLLNHISLNHHHSLGQYNSEHRSIDPSSLEPSSLSDSRFDTFVVRERKEEDQKGERRERSKLRRQTDKERFLTRTINQPVNDIDRLPKVEIDEAVCVGGSIHSTATNSTESSTTEISDPEPPPRPIVTKPPEVKTVRGGGKSSIPVVRSPVKNHMTTQPGNTKKKAGQVPGSLQRQGTFTKEEPSSAIPVPVKKGSAPSTIKKHNHPGGGMGRGRASSLPSKAPGSAVRASSSNQSLKSVAATGGVHVGTASSAAPRWHSNTSLNRPPPTSSPSSVPGSRIASLWKRVDDSKKKQNLTKDTRLWIPPDPSR